jgi:hypothetical protein
MMMVVAVVALTIWCGIEVQRLFRFSNYYRMKESRAAATEQHWRQEAIAYASEAARNEEIAANLEQGKPTGDEQVDTRLLPAILKGPAESRKEYLKDLVRNYQERARRLRRSERFAVAMTNYWNGLRRKRERAARYPWLSVEPDPPQPD